MFWRNNKKTTPSKIATLPRYVIEKVVPNLTSGREDTLVAIAERAFAGARPVTVVEQTLLDYGLDDAMMGALVFAKAVEDASGIPLTDIEYADCYLCSVFCVALGLRENPQVAIDALTEWGVRVSRDIDYLIFADKEQLDDLTETGWDRFVRCHDHPDAILPRAYLDLLAQVIRHRRRGSFTPYIDLDPMIISEPVILGALEVAWEEKVRVFSEHWHGLIDRIRDTANEYEEEFWQG